MTPDDPNPTPPAIHRITPENPPQFPCWIWSGLVGLWWHADEPWQKNYTASDYDAEGQTYWCQSTTRPTVTPDAPTPPDALPLKVRVVCHASGDRCHGCPHYSDPVKNPVCAYAPPAATPTLPPEVREAIASWLYNEEYRPYTSDIPQIEAKADELSSILAPLWPRPAPVTADALRLAGEIYGILINKHDEVMYQPETGKVKVAAVLAPVLRERDQLRAEVLRLQGIASTNADQLATAERVLDAYRVQLAEAKQEARHD